MRLLGDVKGKHVVLLDDMVDTGGTLCKAAEIIMEQGGASVRAMVTHPLLSGNARENIEKSALLEIIVTDTIPIIGDNPKIKVLSTADLFAEVIRRLKRRESISSLFKF
jgi:ribose-phosphate pyrophosphokinase